MSNKEAAFDPERSRLDSQFRGPFQRFLIFAILGLISMDAEDGLDNELAKQIKALQTAIEKGDLVTGQKLMAAILDGFGFSEDFKKNLVMLDDSNGGRSTLKVFAESLRTIKSFRLFVDDYTGTGCRGQMKKLIKTAVFLESVS
jgi:hypothetical protein